MLKIYFGRLLKQKQKYGIYYFHPTQGFSEKPLNNFLKVSGIDIIKFTNGKITSASARSKIKKIMQLAISYIAEKPMNAGAIFND